MLARAEAQARCRLHAHSARASLAQDRLEPGRVRALGQPEAPPPAAPEARAVGAHAGAHLQPGAGVGGEQRQHRVRRRGGPLHMAPERAKQIPAVICERLERALVVAPRALQLARQ